MAFNQFGAGSNVWKSDKHYTLREMTTRKVLKFNPTDIDYHRIFPDVDFDGSLLPLFIS